jgi:hypothetical protein
VEKYAGKPFALLGVNADESPFELKRVQAKANLTWPSFWDGRDGAIAAHWGVDKFPTVFLIDKENIVRWRHEGVPPEGVVEQKIEEALNKPAPKASDDEF